MIQACVNIEHVRHSPCVTSHIGKLHMTTLEERAFMHRLGSDDDHCRAQCARMRRKHVGCADVSRYIGSPYYVLRSILVVPT